MEEEVLNHIDCQKKLQQNHLKSAMLLPSCAFVLRNVYTSARVSVSLTSQRTDQPTSSRSVMSVADGSVRCELLLTPVQSQ